MLYSTISKIITTMQTNYYQIELMSPAQINKEILFNEAVTRLDGFCNSAIKAFTADLPQQWQIGDKYILTQGAQRNNICYILAQSHDWQILSAAKGMTFFCQSINNFITFTGSQWQLCASGQTEQFIGIAGEFIAAPFSTFLSLYVNDDVTIDLGQVASYQLTIILKQNATKASALNWQGSILWPKECALASSLANQIYLLQFYKLAQENTFIATAVDYSY
jgi:hypothetical protein